MVMAVMPMVVILAQDVLSACRIGINAEMTAPGRLASRHSAP